MTTVEISFAVANGPLSSLP